MISTQLYPQAQAEFESEIANYENARRGWGGLLREDVLSTIRRLSEFPHLGRPAPGRTRRFVTKRFRFIVCYELISDQIVVWAVAHPAREPGYWQSRRSP